MKSAAQATSMALNRAEQQRQLAKQRRAECTSPIKLIDEQSRQNAIGMLMSEAVPVFTVYFPSFNRQYGNLKPEDLEAVLNQYAEQMLKIGIGQNGMRNALERLKGQSTTRRFVPTPTEFAELCQPQPEDAGIPPLENCITEIIEARRHKHRKYKYSHYLVRLMDRECGEQMYELSDANWRKLVESSRKRLFKQWLSGEIQEPVALLEVDQKAIQTEAQKTIQKEGGKLLTEQASDPFFARLNQLKQKATS
jgi:hypothetical protein